MRCFEMQGFCEEGGREKNPNLLWQHMDVSMHSTLLRCAHIYICNLMAIRLLGDMCMRVRVQHPHVSDCTQVRGACKHSCV